MNKKDINKLIDRNLFNSMSKQYSDKCIRNYEKIISSIDEVLFKLKLSSKKSINDSPIVLINLKDHPNSPSVYIYCTDTNIYLNDIINQIIDPPLNKVNNLLKELLTNNLSIF